MKKLRYLSMAAILAFTLLLTGCFDSPGEALIGTWVSEPIDAYDFGPAVMTIEVKANPFHLGFLNAHAYAYNAKITYGALEWIIPIPNDDQREELLEVLSDSLNKEDLTEDDLPDFPAFGWACVSLFGDVKKDIAGVYYPAPEVEPESKKLPEVPMPSLYMYGSFTEGSGFLMEEVNVGGLTTLTNVEFTPASGD